MPRDMKNFINKQIVQNMIEILNVQIIFKLIEQMFS